jgi:hypothetical protein
MLLRSTAALLVALLLNSGLAWGGQERHASRSRVSVHDLLQDEPVPTSFAALVPLLTPGYEVVVTDRDGRRRRGTVVSISADAIVLASPVIAGVWETALPLYWPLDVAVVLKRRLTPRSERTFQSGSIQRVDIVDPTGNGTAIGALVGGTLVGATYLWERRQPSSNLKGLATTMALMWGVPVSLRMGHLIDRATNDPIYRAPGSLQVSILPAVDSRSGGVTVVLRW